MLLLGNDFLEAYAACIELSPEAGRDGRLTLMVDDRRVPSLVSTRPRLSSAPLVAVISADSPRVEESSLVPISDNVSSCHASGVRHAAHVLGSQCFTEELYEGIRSRTRRDVAICNRTRRDMATLTY
mmetsp:Transcript_4153/g.13310  ORF Transcript_4153/g.13310 Transcript_4153/m.13310 type:complete len:127 (-) Transcript_4153:28-408(-)